MTVKTHNPQFENMRIAGRKGTWYCVTIHHKGAETFYQLESEQWGDMADHIIVDKNFVEVSEELTYELIYET